MDMKSVEVKSAWLSNINWTAAATAFFGLLAAFGFKMDEGLRVQILSAIVVVGPGLIWFLKTFVSKSVTPSVAKKL